MNGLPALPLAFRESRLPHPRSPHRSLQRSATERTLNLVAATVDPRKHDHWTLSRTAGKTDTELQKLQTLSLPLHHEYSASLRRVTENFF